MHPLLQITDLDALEQRAETARAAAIWGGGILEWQNAQTFFSELEHQNQLILNAAGEGTRPRELDIRVIIANSQTLDREVEANRFRMDLFFHLSVFPIQCIPLRDRPDDIPPLTAHLRGLTCKRLGRSMPVIAAGTMTTLQEYHWPENVRELANVIERGAIVSTEGKLQVDIRPTQVDPILRKSHVLTEAEIDQIRMDNLIACLRATKGKVSGSAGAAMMMGVRPTTLYSRIKTLGLTEADWT